MSHRRVHFTPPAARLPQPDERYVVKQFDRHISRCSTCLLSESRNRIKCVLCPRGQSYGDDLQDYLCYHQDRVRSLIDWPICVTIQDEDSTAGAYLRFISYRRTQLPADAARATSTRVPLSWDPLSSITITPQVSSVRGTSKDEMILYMTIPSFTIPLRLKSESAR